jgi:membrane fusion protein (multidrug efflux system)
MRQGGTSRSSWRRAALQATFAAALLGACDGDDRGAAAPAPAQPIPVGVVEAQLRPVNLGEAFLGRIESVQKVEVRARVAGFLEERLFEEGQTVEAGAPLFRIEKETYEATVAQRRADLAAAQAQAENARAQLARARSLADRGNIAVATLDDRQAADRTAAATVLQAEAALHQAEINLGYTTIEAPIAGRVDLARFDVGDLVGPEAGALTELFTLDPIYVVFQVSQRRLAEAEQEAAAKGLGRDSFVVRVQLQDGSTYSHPGRVDFVGLSVDRNTDTVPVRAILDNPQDRLRDGQFVQVKVERTEAQQAIVIPQSAVQADQQGQFVLAVGAGNRIEVRRIASGQRLSPGLVTVPTGLAEGDQVVVEGIQRVRPGAPVQPHPAEG